MRYLFSLVVAIVIAGGLFLIMRGFISGKSTASTQNQTAQLVNFVSEPKHEQVQTKNRQPPPKPKPPKVPTSTPKVQVKAQNVNVPQVHINVPNLNVPGVGAGGSGPFLGNGFSSSFLSQNGEAIPIVPIQPTYPVQAQLNGVEGYVTVEFTIQPDGTAADPSVIKAKPPRVFNSSAIQALLRSKFKPKVVDGKAVPVRATYTYRYVLPKDNNG